MHVYCDDIVSIIIGNKRAGKSTLVAKLAQECKKKGIKCYCNYPVEGCERLPIIISSSGRELLDKNKFYSTDFSNSVIFIDEASGIWNARSSKSFTEEDTHFFNCLGHTHTQIFLICQYIETLDLNVRRNSTRTMCIYKSFLGLSKIEESITCIGKVRSLDETTNLKGFYNVEYKICEREHRKRYFRRKPYYGLFSSFYVDKELTEPNKSNWNDVYNFEHHEPQTLRLKLRNKFKIKKKDKK